MNSAPTDSIGRDEKIPPGEGWSRNRWLTMLALVFAAQVGLIFLLGEKKSAPPRAVADVPKLTLVADTDELTAMADPTLFAQPHHRDFAAAALKAHSVAIPSFRWTEPPRLLPFAADHLGAVFNRFMQTNFFAGQPPDFKPVVELSVPVSPLEPQLAKNSTLAIEGALAQRQLPAQLALTNWPFAEVLAASVVQVLVDTAGSVVSTTMLTSSGYDLADQRALAIARSLRFKPAASLTIGKVIFNWHTVPPTITP